MNGTEKLIRIVEEIIEIIDNSDCDTTWTRYESGSAIKRDLENTVKMFKNGETKALQDLKLHFAPTGTFQELAIDNGWSERYMELATAFDELIMKK